MSEKQLLVYGADTFSMVQKSRRVLANVAAACRYYGIPRRTLLLVHEVDSVSYSQACMNNLYAQESPRGC
jgi:hypothetical protein